LIDGAGHAAAIAQAGFDVRAQMQGQHVDLGGYSSMATAVWHKRDAKGRRR